LERVLSEPWGGDSATAAFRRKLTSGTAKRNHPQLLRATYFIDTERLSSIRKVGFASKRTRQPSRRSLLF
jgi:hypothetical protein